MNIPDIEELSLKQQVIDLRQRIHEIDNENIHFRRAMEEALKNTQTAINGILKILFGGKDEQRNSNS